MNKNTIERFIELSSKLGIIKEHSGKIDFGEEFIQECKKGMSKEEKELRNYLDLISEDELLDIAVLIILGRDRLIYPNDFESDSDNYLSIMKKCKNDILRGNNIDNLKDYICELVPASNTHGYFSSGFQWISKMQQM